MPSRRANVRRATSAITPEAVEAFKAAQEHQERYHACVAGEGCSSVEIGRHCAECRAHIEACQQLEHALGLKPWECSPLHVSSDDCPAPRDGTAWAESIPQAIRLRAELEGALGALKG